MVPHFRLQRNLPVRSIARGMVVIRDHCLGHFQLLLFASDARDLWVSLSSTFQELQMLAVAMTCVNLLSAPEGLSLGDFVQAHLHPAHRYRSLGDCVERSCCMVLFRSCHISLFVSRRDNMPYPPVASAFFVISHRLRLVSDCGEQVEWVGIAFLWRASLHSQCQISILSSNLYAKSG